MSRYLDTVGGGRRKSVANNLYDKLSQENKHGTLPSSSTNKNTAAANNKPILKGKQTPSENRGGAGQQSGSRRASHATVTSEDVDYVTKNFSAQKEYYPGDNYDDRGLTPLIEACRKNDFSSAQNCISQGYKLEQFDSNGRTALFHAATFSGVEIIELLLQHGASPFIVAGYHEKNCLHKACARPITDAVQVAQIFVEKMGAASKLEQDKAGLLPLHIAINSGNVELVQELLSTNASEQIKAVTIEHNDCALHLAARKSSVEIVQLLVENGATVNIQNMEGQTPLHISAYEQDVETVRYLSECKAQASIKDSNNRTATHLATISGNIEIVEMMADEFHCDLQQRSKDGSTLLHLAAKCGHPEIAMYYLSKGVLVQMPNKDGASALHEAARQGHANVVNALISKGGNIETTTKDGFTALHIAVMYGKHSVVQVLLGEGATVNQLGGERQESPLHLAAKLPRYSEQVVQMLLRSGIKIDQKDEYGDTPLHVAVRHDNYPVAKMLRNEGVKVGSLNKSGETALHVAVKNLSIAIALELLDDMRSQMTKEKFTETVNLRNYKGETVLHYCGDIQPKLESQKTYTDITKLIIDNNAELDVVNNETEETPIHYCCHSGNAEVMRMILSSLSPAQANKIVNKSNKIGWSPLIIASKGGFTSVVRLLLDYQGRIDVFDENGKNALHISCENGHMEVAETLLAKRAYPDAKTKLGDTPVSLAASKGHNQLIDLLVARYKASYDIRSLEKQVALHKAAENGHVHACKSLLDFGADPNVKDIKGQMPIHAACENDHPQVVNMFLDRYPELGRGTNKEGNNCAHIAAYKGSYEVMKMLIKSDAKMASQPNKTTGQQPIHYACAGGHSELVDLLLEQGDPVGVEDKEGNTPMHLAAKYGHNNIIDTLKSKISVSVVSIKNGFSPIHSAAEHDKTQVIDALLQKVPSHTLSECPANKAAEETDFGLTPLHMAAKSGHEASVRKLVQADDCVLDHKTTKDGYTALHLAIIEGHQEVASLILARSAELIVVEDADGRCVIHHAAANGHLKLVQLLLGQGSPVNGVDSKNWTPLHYAANAGHLEICRFLVGQDGSTILEDKDEKVPIIYAAQNHHIDTLQYLFAMEYEVELLLADTQFISDVMVCSKKNSNRSVLDFILYSTAPIYVSIMLRNRYNEEAGAQQDKSSDFIAISNFCEEVTFNLVHIGAPYGMERFFNSVDAAKRPLLDLLIDFEFKECVAHPSIQSYVSELWSGDVNLEGMKGNLLAVVLFLFPPLWLFMSAPLHRWNKIPTIKFICHLVSHLYFILCLCVVIVVPWDRSGSEIYPTPWDCVLLIWLVAIFLAQIVEEGSSGVRMFVCITSSIALGVNIWAIFEPEGRERETLMYYRDNIFAFVFLALIVQLSEFLSMHEVFGPWIVIIYALVLDVLKFLIVLFMVVGAFTMHMCVIYKPAYNKKKVDFPEGLVDKYIVVGDINTIFKDLFFACFGLSNIPKVELSAVERNDNPAETATIAIMVFALYQIVAIIVLVNLLIAMMGNTYAIIDERSEVEWKFGRARIIWNMTKTTSVPVPLNIVATFFVFFRVLFLSNFTCCLTNVKKVHNDMLMYGGLEEEVENEDDDGAEELDPEKGSRQVSIANVVPWKEVREAYFETHGEEEA